MKVDVGVVAELSDKPLDPDVPVELGSRAGELIGLIQLGKTYSMPFDKLYHVIYPYPTYGEVIWHAAHKAYIKKLEDNVVLKLLRKILS